MPDDERTRLDRPQRWTTREHPEGVLIARLKACTSVTNIYELCLSVIDDAGYDTFVDIANQMTRDFVLEAKSGGEGEQKGEQDGNA